MPGFVGPSYPLSSRVASVERSVNLIPVPLESPTGARKTAYRDAPGLTLLVAGSGAIRGGAQTNGRAFVVVGNKFCELSSAWVLTELGTLGTAIGWCDVKSNATQVFCTDGLELYCYTKDTGAFQIVTGYPGGKRIDVLNEFLLFTYADSGKLGWSNVGDGTSLDALNFATAESAPDNLTGVIKTNGQVLLPGLSSCEIWSNVGGDDVFARNGSAVIEAGCASPYSIQSLDNTVFWVGSSEQFGQGIVFRLNGYTPVRISTRWIEELLQGIDLSEAYAYTYQQEGSAFYFLQVPSLSTTLCYDVLTGLWHERAELVNGEYERDRADVHLFFNNTHIVGDAEGNLYKLDPEAHSKAGDVLCRDRVMPVISTPDQRLLRFAELECICDKGQGGTLLVRWSNDNGANWGNWHQISMGALGEFRARVRKLAMGASRNRVYQLRVTDDVSWNPLDVAIRAV